MNLTSFLAIFFIMLGLGIGLVKILNSRAIRVLLLSYLETRNEIKIQEELRLSRQRTFEEIKNPDKVLEAILSIKRGEEVKIPLAAFDYIYRNLKKFTIIDKEGRWINIFLHRVL
jgi:hypothetical protein